MTNVTKIYIQKSLILIKVHFVGEMCCRTGHEHQITGDVEIFRQVFGDHGLSPICLRHACMATNIQWTSKENRIDTQRPINQGQMDNQWKSYGAPWAARKKQWQCYESLTNIQGRSPPKNSEHLKFFQEHPPEHPTQIRRNSDNIPLKFIACLFVSHWFYILCW